MKGITDIVKTHNSGYRAVEIYYTFADKTVTGPYYITEEEYALQSELVRLSKKYHIPNDELDILVDLARTSYQRDIDDTDGPM